MSDQSKKLSVKEQNNYQRDKEREKVRGVFRFYEVPGGVLSFSFRKWKGDPIENYTLEDGKIYEIPLGVAMHLNNNCWYPEYGFVPGEQGDKGMRGSFTPGLFGNQAVGMRIMKKIHRTGFQSLDFMDVQGLQAPKPIVAAEFTV